MNNFQRLLENLLTEMPYIEIGDQVTDLELETIKSKSDFITMLKYLFGYSKSTPKDKYDSNIVFKSKRDRDKLKQQLGQDPHVQDLLRKFKISVPEFKQLLKTL